MRKTMKKKTYIIHLLWAIILLPIIAACSKDEGGEDAMHVDHFTILVKFESPTGTNILDSLNLVLYKDSLLYNDNTDIIDLDWNNKGNNLENNIWKKPSLHWVNITDDWGSENPNFSFKNVGTVLYIQLCDRRVSRSNFHECDDIYDINIRSKAIFGNDNPHTIRYHVHINGHACGYYATKCEVDGKDYPFEGPYLTIHPEYGIQIVELLVKFKVNPKQQE